MRRDDLRAWAGRPHQAAACALGAALLGAASWTFADEGFLDRRQIVEELTGQSSATRGIAVETAGSAPSPFATATLPAIRFEHNSARLTATAQRQVGELGAALRTAPLDMFRFAVQGHTDSSGSASYNRGLSLRRARSVERSLLDEGIDGARLTAVGLGEDHPQRGLAAADPSNRRVEIVSLGLWRRSAPLAAPTDASGGRALLIGIDDYTTVSPLSGAPVNDVKALLPYVRDRLGFSEDGIRTLLDAEATRANILDAIANWLVPSPGPALLYFSGHGYQQRDLDGDEADGWDETLVPVDVIVERGVAKGMITDDEIADLLSARRNGKMDVVIDACHSGTLTRNVADAPDWRLVKSPRLPDGGPLLLGGATRGASQEEAAADSAPEAFMESNNPNLTLWTAVRADQKALVDAQSSPEFISVFTRRLLSGARDEEADEDRDGRVTARELLAYVRRESTLYCASNPANCPGDSGLTPQLSISPDAVDQPAFAVPPAALSSVASLAKDILVSPTAVDDRDATNEVKLRLIPGTKLRLGEEVEVVVESERDGALVLLDIDAAGQLTQVFPNEPSLRGGVPPVVKKGEPLALPGQRGGFRFRARPPQGRGLLVAVVAEDETRLASLTARHKDLAVIPRADAFVVELAGHLRRWHDLGWSYGQLEYLILEE